MCKCTPEIKTPFCGKPGCEWPAQREQPSSNELVAALRKYTYWLAGPDSEDESSLVARAADEIERLAVVIRGWKQLHNERQQEVECLQREHRRAMSALVRNGLGLDEVPAQPPEAWSTKDLAKRLREFADGSNYGCMEDLQGDLLGLADDFESGTFRLSPAPKAPTFSTAEHCTCAIKDAQRPPDWATVCNRYEEEATWPQHCKHCEHEQRCHGANVYFVPWTNMYKSRPSGDPKWYAMVRLAETPGIISMSRRKTIKAWAAVGSHGQPFVCAFSAEPRLNNRYEIYDTADAAFKSGPFAREVTISLGPMLRPLGKPASHREQK